jgi:hypothetical protein
VINGRSMKAGDDFMTSRSELAARRVRVAAATGPDWHLCRTLPT